MPIQDVTILGQSEKTKFLDGGRVVTGVETSFRVGRDGPFTVFLADDEFTPEAMRNAIEKRADQVRAARAPFTPQS